MMNTTGNAGLDALADAIAERVYQRLEVAQGKHRARLLSVTDAAEYVGRTPSAIRHMIGKGILPSVRRDGRVYLDCEDLDDWIEMGKTRG
jgi:excisionase family DNA binding protein